MNNIEELNEFVVARSGDIAPILNNDLGDTVKFIKPMMDRLKKAMLESTNPKEGSVLTPIILEDLDEKLKLYERLNKLKNENLKLFLGFSQKEIDERLQQSILISKILSLTPAERIEFKTQILHLNMTKKTDQM